MNENESDTRKDEESENREKAIQSVMNTFERMYEFIDRFVEQRSSEKSQ